MDLSELKEIIPKEVIESAKKREITSLTPPQELAIRLGLLSGENMVVAAPTASGKTFIAEMPMLKSILWDRRKVVYIAPMRALVTEKYNELKEEYPYLKIAISIGDLDSLDPWLDRYDLIFVSTEKFDSLLRHGLSWLDSVGCIVFDEIHMLDEVGRGPTLEVLITKLRRLCKDSQFIALSATIGNAEEISEWLGARLVVSDYRPVLLEKGVELNGSVEYGEKSEKLLGSSKLPELRITEDIIARRKQLIIFYATRRNAEAGAERLSQVTDEHLGEEERRELNGVSEKLLNALSRPTAQCERLSRYVLKGTAFHHSGLVNAQRNLIENAFKAGIIKAICSTTTLGLGVNLPAHTVVVRDTSRYSDGEGTYKMPVNEVLQLFGRAGRPKYDTTGRALLIAKSSDDLEFLYKRYIKAKPEPITSKLGVQPALRTHILAFIASNFLRRSDSILGFLGESFYGHQYSNSREMKRIVERILEELTDWRFVEKRGSGVYDATRIGRRVSELYIDPVSAKWLIDSLPRINDEVSSLFMLTNTLEMRPYSRATEEAEERIVQYYHMLQGSGTGNEYETYYEPERPFSTALMLRDWIAEASENSILIKYRETPGSLYSKLSNADWLIYSSAELAKLLHMNHSRLLELRVRLRYGIKKELLDLIRLEQVGRVRARIMFNAGMRSVSDLRREGSELTLGRLFGKEIAERIHLQLNTLDEN